MLHRKPDRGPGRGRAGRAGGLAGVLKLLRDNDISVEYLYSFVRRVGNDAIIIFRVDQPERAGNLLRDKGVAPARAGRDRLIPRSFIHRPCISLHNWRRFPAQKRGEPPLLSACARNCMKLSKKILANRVCDHYNNTVRSRAGVAIRSHRKGKVT